MPSIGVLFIQKRKEEGYAKIRNPDFRLGIERAVKKLSLVPRLLGALNYSMKSQKKHEEEVSVQVGTVTRNNDNITVYVCKIGAAASNR